MAEEIKVLCPWCNKGEVYIEGAGNANVSIKCPRCQHCFKLRLNDFSTVRIQPHRKLPEAAASGRFYMQSRQEDLTMRNFSIDIVWAKIQMAVAAIGGWLGYFLGGMDGLMIALIIFMVLDYITGLMCAVIDKKLSSAVGFKGICKKVVILMLVGVANVVDIHIVGTGSALRSAVICFYLSNEGLSLLENAAHIGLPIPDKMKDVLAQLHGRIDEKKDDEKDGEQE